MAGTSNNQAIANSQVIALSTPAWQTHLKFAIRDLPTLLAELELTPHECGVSQAAATQFAVRVPRAFVSRMQKGNPRDPLLLQVLATNEELETHSGFTTDPLEEQSANPTRGLIHKYRGRALLMPTTACAVNCRYCFRRHFPYENNRLDTEALDQVVNYLMSDSSLTEIILSGGDPLLLDDELLQRLVIKLETVPHLRRLRIHSRTPVVIPERLTDELGQLLRDSRLAPSLVIHCNHPNEIDDALSRRLLTLRDFGIAIFNQSVLLKGINDSADTLIALSEKLFDCGVIPYYLHQLDQVQGAAHFAIPDARALELHNAMRRALPGYLLPALVRELPGEPNKTPL